MQHLYSAYSLSALNALHIITLTSTCFIPTHTSTPGEHTAHAAILAQRTNPTHSQRVMSGTQLWLSEPIPKWRHGSGGSCILTTAPSQLDIMNPIKVLGFVFISKHMYHKYILMVTIKMHTKYNISEKKCHNSDNFGT